MAKIEMHVHSTFSDGKGTPKEILETAIRDGVTHLSITDHDDIRGSIELCRLAALPEYAGKITVIPGVEISAKDDFGVTVHILAYGFDPKDENFVEKFKLISEKKLFSSKKTFDVFEVNMPKKSFEFVSDEMKISAKNGLLTKEKAYQILSDNNISFERQKNVIDQQLSVVTNEKGIDFDLIRDNFKEEIASGKLIFSLAHPTLYKFDFIKKSKGNTELTFEKALSIFKSKGVNFLEVFHDFEEDENYINKLAYLSKKIGFGISGGISDAHNSYSRLGKRKDGTELQYCSILEKLLSFEKVSNLKSELGLTNELYLTRENKEEKEMYLATKFAREQNKIKAFHEKKVDEKSGINDNNQRIIMQYMMTYDKIMDIKAGKSTLLPKIQISILGAEIGVIKKLESLGVSLAELNKIRIAYMKEQESVVNAVYEKIAKSVMQKSPAFATA